MHPKFITKSIIEGCFFELTDRTTGECFNYATSEHDEDEVMVMGGPTPEYNLMPMCNIYPKEDYMVIPEAFAMIVLPKQMETFYTFWTALLEQKEVNIEFSYIKRGEGPLIECANEIEV
jgi:hypothetical protein